MAEKEAFLSRWSRLKRAVASPDAAVPAVPADLPEKAGVELPSLESLDFNSDFSCFLQPQVEESLKCAALKKLFHSGPFNTMDGLDVYVDDYGKFEPIPEEMLRMVEHARGLLYPREAPPEAAVDEEGPAAVAGPTSPEPPQSSTG